MGVHSCLVYETKNDLCQVVIPFFEEGFRKNEFCLWIVQPSIGILDLREVALDKAALFDAAIQSGKFKIIDALDWYMEKGVIDADKIMKKLTYVSEYAAEKGFTNVRVSGDETWLDLRDWDTWLEYERSVNELIKKRNITALCTYPMRTFQEAETFLLCTCHGITARKSKGSALEYVMFNHG